MTYHNKNEHWKITGLEKKIKNDTYICGSFIIRFITRNRHI